MNIARTFENEHRSAFNIEFNARLDAESETEHDIHRATATYLHERFPEISELVFYIEQKQRREDYVNAMRDAVIAKFHPNL